MNSGSGGRLDEKHGGRFTWGDGFFCHSFCNRLVTPAKYFDKHPEYCAGEGQAAERDPATTCTTHSHPHLHGRIASGDASPAEGYGLFRVDQRLWKLLRVPGVPDVGQTGRLADGPGAAIGQSRGRGRGKGVSRQGDRNVGVYVCTTPAETHPAAAERHHPTGPDWVLHFPSDGHVQLQREPGRPCRSGGLGERHVADLDLGRCHRFGHYLAPVPTTHVAPNIRYYVATTSRVFFWRTPTTRGTASFGHWAAT